MKLIKKFLYSGSISPVTEEDYLNYWRDNNVETDEALIQRLAEKYGPDHMLNWIALRLYEKDNPYSVHTGTGEINPTPKKSMSTKFADAVENTINSNTLPGGLARTIGVATLGAAALTHLPATIGGLASGKLVDKATGGFGNLIENLTGVDSRLGDFFNPGYIIGGYAGNAAKNLAWNIEARLLETAMRTTSYPNPTADMLVGFKDMLNNDKRRIFDIFKYIVTGKTKGPKGYYNSWDPYDKGSLYYTGFDDVDGLKSLSLVRGKDDIIDAILYNKKVDPSLGMRRTAIGKDFGLHTDYVLETYPKVAPKIQVYELDTPNAVPESSILRLGKVRGATLKNDLFSTGAGIEVDAAGHMELFGYGADPRKVYLKAEDIYGFNPQRYRTKYTSFFEGSPIKRFFANIGLNRVNKHITPIITKAKWQPIKIRKPKKQKLIDKLLFDFFNNPE